MFVYSSVTHTRARVMYIHMYNYNYLNTVSLRFFLPFLNNYNYNDIPSIINATGHVDNLGIFHNTLHWLLSSATLLRFSSILSSHVFSFFFSPFFHPVSPGIIVQAFFPLSSSTGELPFKPYLILQVPDIVAAAHYFFYSIHSVFLPHLLLVIPLFLSTFKFQIHRWQLVPFLSFKALLTVFDLNTCCNVRNNSVSYHCTFLIFCRNGILYKSKFINWNNLFRLNLKVTEAS